MISGAYTLQGQSYGFRLDAGRLTGPEDLRRWVNQIIDDGTPLAAPVPLYEVDPGLSPPVSGYLTLQAALFDNADAFTLSWPEWDDVPDGVVF